jgi:hypothetical protein
MHVGEFWRIFQTKIGAMTPVFMPVDFGKDPNPFDFQRHATEDARKKQTRSSAKTTEQLAIYSNGR